MAARSRAALEAVVYSVFELIIKILDLLSFVIIAVAIMSWLISFNVINIYNNVVRAIYETLTAVTEPLLRPIRRMLPNLNGVDLSPVVLLLLIWFIQRLIVELIFKPQVFG